MRIVYRPLRFAIIYRLLPEIKKPWPAAEIFRYNDNKLMMKRV